MRVLPTILEYKHQNNVYPKVLSMSLAYLIYFYKNDVPNDAEDVIFKMKNNSVSDILKDTSFWGIDISDMSDIVTLCYEKIENLGAKGAMEWILSE